MSNADLQQQIEAKRQKLAVMQQKIAVLQQMVAQQDSMRQQRDTVASMMPQAGNLRVPTPQPSTTGIDPRLMQMQADTPGPGGRMGLPIMQQTASGQSLQEAMGGLTQQPQPGDQPVSSLAVSPEAQMGMGREPSWAIELLGNVPKNVANIVIESVKDVYNLVTPGLRIGSTPEAVERRQQHRQRQEEIKQLPEALQWIVNNPGEFIKENPVDAAMMVAGGVGGITKAIGAGGRFARGMGAARFAKKKVAPGPGLMKGETWGAGSLLSKKSGIQSVKDIFTKFHRQARGAQYYGRALEREIAEAIPDPRRQLLMQHAAQQPERYYGLLTNEEKIIYQNKIKPALQKLERLAEEMGVEKAPEKIDLPLSPEQQTAQMLGLPVGKAEQTRFQYFPGWYKKRHTDIPHKFKYSPMSKHAPQEIPKYHPSIEAGLETGLHVAHTNPGRVIAEALESMTQAAASRKALGSLNELSTKAFGRVWLGKKFGGGHDLRMVEKWSLLDGKHATEGYVRFTPEILDKPLYTLKGKEIPLQGAVGVREEIFPFVKAYIENPNYGTASQINFALKSLKLGFSFFHHMSLAKQELALGRVPFTNVKRGLKLQHQKDPDMKLLFEEGLEMGRYEDVNYGKLYQFTGPKGQKLNKPARWMQWPGEQMSKLLFEVVQPGMKTSYVYDSFIRGWPKAQKRGLSRREWARECVKSGDAFFSGEDVKRAMLESHRLTAKLYFSPGARRAWQMLFLSPTWQRQHLLTFGRVGKALLNKGTAPQLYQRYFAGAVALYGAANYMNWLWTKEMDKKGRFMFENEFSKQTRIRAPFNYPDGRAAYFRPFKSILEVPDFARHAYEQMFKEGDPPTEGIMGKLSPVFNATAQAFGLTGYKRYGGLLGKYEKNIGGLGKRAVDWTVDIAMPITFSQWRRVIEGNLPWQGGVLGSFGLPVSKEHKEKKAVL